MVILSLLSVVGISAFARDNATGSINGCPVGGVSDVIDQCSYSYASGGFGSASVQATFVYVNYNWDRQPSVYKQESCPAQSSPNAYIRFNLPSNGYKLVRVSGNHSVSVNNGGWSGSTVDSL